jgi:F420-0:gamma-glutamyl ligase-like protein
VKPSPGRGPHPEQDCSFPNVGSPLSRTAHQLTVQDTVRQRARRLGDVRERGAQVGTVAAPQPARASEDLAAPSIELVLDRGGVGVAKDVIDGTAHSYSLLDLHYLAYALTATGVGHAAGVFEAIGPYMTTAPWALVTPNPQW